MKPNKLIICGWGPYKDQVEVDFDAFHGIFLITGSTGAGKTTIFDAITYALYGSLSGETRDKERNSVRSDFAAPEVPTFVELSMEHNGAKYHIKRNPEYLRPSKRGNTFTKEKENALLTMPDGKIIEGVKDVNAKIEEILTLDYSQFKQISMIAQGEFTRLLTAKPSDKTKIFREIFGTGIYERFTQNLSAKVRVPEKALQEVRQRLDEDIRLLKEELRGVDLSEELKHSFEEMIGAPHLNYDKILEVIEQMIAETKEFGRKTKTGYDKLDQAIEKKNGTLIQVEENNKKVVNFQRAEEERRTLEELKDSFAKKQSVYQKALNAALIEGVATRGRFVDGKVKEFTKQEEQLLLSMEENERKRKELFETYSKRDVVSEAIEILALLEQEEEALHVLQRENKNLSERFKDAQEVFVREENKSKLKKDAYEEALRNQRRAAIGIAASMLVPGEPCPVCGSLEHPNPAKVDEGILSEEEMETLKLEMEAQERVVSEKHNEALTLKVKVEEMAKNLNEKETLTKEKRDNLSKITDLVLKEILQKGAKKAADYVKTVVEQYQRLETIFGEQEERKKSLALEIQNAKKELEEAKLEWKKALAEHGFESTQDYLDSAKTASERKELETSIENYNRKVAANKELLQHMKENLTSFEIVDTTPLKEEISDLRIQKTNMLSENKLWEKCYGQLHRTKVLMQEKGKEMDKHRAEYGYLKELENIATGNNPKKLVFEQYVLAGYFEEILNAANHRFAKMSSGRYRMQRIQEVGDGRTKDNLEIEVMDFYTGKARSIRTLSGGESFKASLSLALGLSDVIQAMNGGVKVDTLFIDEGFGSLDKESLDAACETLGTLVEKDRLIGIISHVQELRDRMGQQIIVEKTGSGSIVKTVVN